MKYKQLRPKSIRPIISINKQHVRCSLCDSLLKTSSSYRYLFTGKSIHEEIIINNNKTITYAECYKRYLNETCVSDKLHMICPKCCQQLQCVHSLHLDAEELTKKIRCTSSKTKRLNRVRQIHQTDEQSTAKIKDEVVLPNHSCDIVEHSPIQITQEIYQNSPCQQTVNNAPTTVPYAQFMIDSPTSSTFPASYQSNASHNDVDRSLSPCPNDDENPSKPARLNRRQYDFLIKLPDQESLNSFIEKSASESACRWTWRRTSANSHGYKVYYVCNYSMRRHYQPCHAAMYALFHPEGSISIYSCGQHEHIPKDHLPLNITDESKEEIFQCLQRSMATTDIREHLIRLKLPFGNMRKLNNFIKYHKELLRFGSVTNVRVGGTAYRQPQYWAIRRPINTNTTEIS